MADVELTERQKRRSRRHEALWWVFFVILVVAALIVPAYFYSGMMKDLLDAFIIDPVNDWWRDLLSPSS